MSKYNISTVGKQWFKVRKNTLSHIRKNDCHFNFLKLKIKPIFTFASYSSRIKGRDKIISCEWYFVTVIYLRNHWHKSLENVFYSMLLFAAWILTIPHMLTNSANTLFFSVSIQSSQMQRKNNYEIWEVQVQFFYKKHLFIENLLNFEVVIIKTINLCTRIRFDCWHCSKQELTLCTFKLLSYIFNL